MEHLKPLVFLISNMPLIYRLIIEYATNKSFHIEYAINITFHIEYAINITFHIEYAINITFHIEYAINITFHIEYAINMPCHHVQYDACYFFPLPLLCGSVSGRQSVSV